MGTASVDVATALDLRTNHKLTFQEIAKLQGVPKQAIQQRLKPLLPTPETKVYQDNRADILSEAQLQLLIQLDPARLKKMSARDAVISFGILYDKERLERGQSTSINTNTAELKLDRERYTIRVGVMVEVATSGAPANPRKQGLREIELTNGEKTQ